MSGHINASKVFRLRTFGHFVAVAVGSAIDKIALDVGVRECIDLLDRRNARVPDQESNSAEEEEITSSTDAENSLDNSINGSH